MAHNPPFGGLTSSHVARYVRKWKGGFRSSQLLKGTQLRKKIWLVAPVLGALVVTAQPATAAPQQNSSVAGIEAELAGLTSAQLLWQGEFNVAATAVAEQHPDAFAEALIDETGGAGTIAFSAAAPDGALQILSSVSNVTIVENAGFTDREEAAATAAIWESVSGITDAPVQVAVLPLDDVIEVTVGADRENSARRGADPVVVATDAIEIPSDYDIVVDYAGASAFDNAAENLVAGNKLSGGGASCSTAFPVKRANGPEIGLLTAGHCPGKNVTYGGTGGYFTVLPFSQFTGTGTNGGDMRWLWSNTMFNGNTRVGYNTTRRFTATATPSVGSTAYKFGHTTGYTYDKVTSRNVQYTLSVRPEDGGGSYAVGPLVQVASHVSDNGDSGGAWFSGVTAYGIHSGAPNNRSAFTPVNAALNRFGLVLWRG